MNNEEILERMTGVPFASDADRLMAADALRILPPSSSGNGMSEDDMCACLNEIARLRASKGLLIAFEECKLVPRIKDGQVLWFAVEHDPLGKASL